MNTCSECGRPLRLPVSLSIKTAHCRGCGDDLMRTNDGGWRRVYPALHMQPIPYHIPADVLYSKWMPSHTRPAIAGEYDTRFQHTEPHVIRLVWGGRYWYNDDYNIIDTSKLLTWRGVLA